MKERTKKMNTTFVGLMALVVAAMILAWVPGCKGPYDAAWRTLDGILKARDLTAQQLASVAETKRKDCVKQHGAKTEGYAACIKAHREALEHWRKNVRPAVNTGVQITATALGIAEKVKADPKIDWMVLIRPSACALLRAVKSWGHYFADKGKAVLGALVSFEGVVCHE
jgi:hypothetical protein